MSSPNGLNLFLLIVSILEMLLLQVGFVSSSQPNIFEPTGSACSPVVTWMQMRGKVKWEGMWVIFVECVAYGAALVPITPSKPDPGSRSFHGICLRTRHPPATCAQQVSPDADFVSIRLTNGMWVEWMRYAGWILTCPVLLMTLVSMTTEDGTKAPTVRLVPLLVANLTMVLLGITAAANLAPVKWYIFAIALCFGGVVFSSAIQCFIALRRRMPKSGPLRPRPSGFSRVDGVCPRTLTVRAVFRGRFESSPNGSVRNSSLALALTFLAGWGCFPAAFLTGHSGTPVLPAPSCATPELHRTIAATRPPARHVQAGMDVISVDMQWGLFVIGDILSKNCWVAIAVLRQHQFDLYNAAQELEAQAYAEEAQETSAPRIKRRGSNSHIIIDEVNNNQQSSFTNPTYQYQQSASTKQPRARPAPSVTQMQFQQHVHNTPQQQQMVPVRMRVAVGHLHVAWVPMAAASCRSRALILHPPRPRRVRSPRAARRRTSRCSRACLPGTTICRLSSARHSCPSSPRFWARATTSSRGPAAAPTPCPRPTRTYSAATAARDSAARRTDSLSTPGRCPSTTARPTSPTTHSECPPADRLSSIEKMADMHSQRIARNSNYLMIDCMGEIGVGPRGRFSQSRPMSALSAWVV
jgi:hypothetical protein